MTGPIATAFVIMDLAEAGPALEGIAQLGFTEFLIIQEPDRNLLEVHPRI